MARMNPTVRTWLITLVCLGAVVGIIALAGGFNPRDTSARRIDVGVEIATTRWYVSVNSCEVEPAEDADGGDVTIHLDAENRWWATLDRLEPAVGVELPTGEKYGFSDEWFSTRSASGGGFDPGFAQQASLRLETEQPLWEPDQPITVNLYDEASDDGYLASDRWYPSEMVAKVELVCTILEVEE